MILVDTPVWIDHLHTADAVLQRALDDGVVMTHPMIRGELSIGTLKDRASFLRSFDRLPVVLAARHGSVLHLIELRTLFGRGLSFIDVHLLAACRATPGLELWTRDQRLLAVAGDLGVAWQP